MNFASFGKQGNCKRNLVSFFLVLFFLLASLMPNTPSNAAALPVKTPILQVKVNDISISNCSRDNKYGVLAPFSDVLSALGYKVTVKNDVISGTPVEKHDASNPGITSVRVAGDIITVYSIEASGSGSAIKGISKSISTKMAMKLQKLKNGKLIGQLKVLSDAMKLIYNDDKQKNIVTVTDTKTINKAGQILIEPKNSAHKELIDRIDSLTKGLMGSEKYSPTPIDKELNSSDPQKRAAAYMGLADDMCYAQIMGLLDNNMLYEAARAAKEYPHPLLLNNLGAIAVECGKDEDALYLFESALVQDPGNPVILMNAANLYFGMDNDSKAKSYAQKALSNNSDFGPAYQLLTVLHLKNENYILAAETMIKSMNYCYNGLTYSQVESFLDSADELDPLEDKYPLEPSMIDELYKIASKQVDARGAAGGVDTPDAQVKIKPAGIGTADAAKEHAYKLAAEAQEIEKKMNETIDARLNLKTTADDYYDDITDGAYMKLEKMVTLKTLRQISAVKILNSFYNFKFSKDERKMWEENSKSEQDMKDLLDKTREKYEKEKQDYRDKIGEEAWGRMNEMLISALNDKPIPQDNEALTGKFKEYLALDLQSEKAVYDIRRKYSNDIISNYAQHYDMEKQILEEWWLKSGGLMKYIAVKDVFDDFDYQRQTKAYEFSKVYLEEMSSYGMELISQETIVNEAQYRLDVFTKGEEEAERALARLKAEEERRKNEADKGSGEDIPEWEKQAISNYREIGDLSPIGVEGNLFGVASVAAEFDGKSVSAEADSPVAKGGVQKDLDSGEACYYYAVGAQAVGKTEWLTERKFVEKALGNAGPVTKGLGNTIGKIKFGFSQGTKQGEYACIDRTGAVTDKGLIYIRESGADISEFGKTKSVEVKKSLVTGIATKESSTTYKFMFASVKVMD